MKFTKKHFIVTLSLLAVFGLLSFLPKLDIVKAEFSSGELTGWGWSSNIGWVSFDGGNYGVTLASSTGTLGGYAWSSNVGWISFNLATNSNCPLQPEDGGDCTPRVDMNTGKVQGWARALAGCQTDLLNGSGGCTGSGSGNANGTISSTTGTTSSTPTDSIVIKNATLPQGRKTYCTERGSTHDIYCFRNTTATNSYNAQILQYNPGTDILTTKSTIPSYFNGELRCAENSATDKIYCFADSNSIDTTHQDSSVMEYNPTTNVAVKTGDATSNIGDIWLPDCKENTSTNKIYCFTRTQTLEYVTTSDSLNGKANLPATNNLFSCAENSATHKIYCLGGFAGSAPTNSIYEYTPSSNTFSVKSGTLPIATSQISCAENSGTHKIYCFGGGTGSGGSTLSDKIVEYDPATDVARTMPSVLPSPRATSCSENSATHKIYCFGGTTSSGNTNQIVEYTVGETTTTGGTTSTLNKGWDGWIHLSGTNHASVTGLAGTAVSNQGVSFNKETGIFSGYAWGSDVVGWLSFNPGLTGVPPVTFPPDSGGGQLGGSCSGTAGTNSATWTMSPTGGTTYTYSWNGAASTTNNTFQINGTGVISGPTVAVASADGKTGNFSCSNVNVGTTTSQSGKMWLNNNANLTTMKVRTGQTAKVNWDVRDFTSSDYSCSEDSSSSISGWYDGDAHVTGSAKLLQMDTKGTYNLKITCRKNDNQLITNSTNAVQIIVTDSTIEEI